MRKVAHKGHTKRMRDKHAIGSKQDVAISNLYSGTKYIIGSRSSLTYTGNSTPCWEKRLSSDCFKNGKYPLSVFEWSPRITA